MAAEDLEVVREEAKDAMRKSLESLQRDMSRVRTGRANPALLEAVQVDYDIWYPFVWYVRDHDRDGRLRFSCFKSEGESGWNDSCTPGPPTSSSQSSPWPTRVWCFRRMSFATRCPAP